MAPLGVAGRRGGSAFGRVRIAGYRRPPQRQGIVCMPARSRPSRPIRYPPPVRCSGLPRGIRDACDPAAPTAAIVHHRFSIADLELYKD